MNKNAKDLKYHNDHLIITDPPYNIGYKYEGDYIDKQSLDDYQALFEPMKGHRVVMIHYLDCLISDIIPILGIPNKITVWSYPSNMGNKCYRVIAWFNCAPTLSKVRVPYKNPKDKRIIELVKRTGGRSLTDHWHINLVKNVSSEKIKGYTNQIPKEIIKNIIKTTAKEGDIIIDPFSGTGTTPCVAKELSFDFEWYDINQTAIELTLNRLHKTT